MIQNQYFFIKLVTNKYYYYFTLSQLLLTCFLTLLIFILQSAPIQVELTIVLFLFLDILLKYFSQGQQGFWKSYSNKADCFIAGFLLLVIVTELLIDVEKEMEKVSSLLLLTRGLIQLYRVARLLKQSKQTRQMHTLSDVQFNLDHENLEQEGEGKSL